jgi:hypothetical protein
LFLSVMSAWCPIARPPTSPPRRAPPPHHHRSSRALFLPCWRHVRAALLLQRLPSELRLCRAALPLFPPSPRRPHQASPDSQSFKPRRCQEPKTYTSVLLFLFWVVLLIWGDVHVGPVQIYYYFFNFLVLTSTYLTCHLLTRSKPLTHHLKPWQTGVKVV